MTGRFELRGVGMRYGDAEVLRNVNLDIGPGVLTSIVGPNGAGKSTLLGIMAGLRAGYAGQCGFDGIELYKWPRRRLARRVSFVPQSVRIEFPFTAEQVVLMGRTPHAEGIFETEEDHAAVHRAMDQTDTLHLARRDFRSLSGGERQRVILASALAQSPEALLLDEPTTFLDIQHQVSLYRILRDLRAAGLVVITVTHDLNLAAAYAGRVVMLSRGEVVADAPPAEALQPERLDAVFGVHTELLRTPEGRHWIRYGD